MATVESWGGTITDIGPIYPMVGAEGLLVVIGVPVVQGSLLLGGGLPVDG